MRDTKKVFPIICAIITIVSSVAAQRIEDLPTLQQKKFKPIDPVKRYEKTGGWVMPEATPPYFMIVHPESIKKIMLQNATEQMRTIFSVPIKFQTANSPVGDPVLEVSKLGMQKDVACVILIGDKAGYPSLLVAPENCWAFINLATLKENGQFTSKTEERLRKEIWRAFGNIMGAANTSTVGCVLKPVFSVNDLDQVEGFVVGPEIINKVIEQSRLLGMKPHRKAYYRTAIAEGWAPPPTNDVQRALWIKAGKTPPKK
jgi:hypothetical protein